MSERATVTGRNLGGLTFDVTVEESHEDGLTITEHPVEQGAAVNDHAYLKARTVTLRAAVSDSGHGEGHSKDFYAKLLELQKKREPIEIVTGKRLYKNMLVETVSSVTDASTEHALVVSAACREIIIVKTQTASVPPRARHKSPAKTGGTTDKGQKQAKRQSILKAGLG